MVELKIWLTSVNTPGINMRGRGTKPFKGNRGGNKNKQTNKKVKVLTNFPIAICVTIKHQVLLLSGASLLPLSLTWFGSHHCLLSDHSDNIFWKKKSQNTQFISKVMSSACWAASRPWLLDPVPEKPPHIWQPTPPTARLGWARWHCRAPQLWATPTCSIWLKFSRSAHRNPLCLYKH